MSLLITFTSIMGESYIPIKNRVAIRTGSPISKELARKRYPITATLTLIPDPFIRAILRGRVAIYAHNPSFMTTLEVFLRFRQIAHLIASNSIRLTLSGALILLSTTIARPKKPSSNWRPTSRVSTLESTITARSYIFESEIPPRPKISRTVRALTPWARSYSTIPLADKFSSTIMA